MWNVNTYEEIKEAGVQLELIETLWNVNLIVLEQQVQTSRINRNIVECKYTHNLYDNLHYLELIETLWNVNDIQEYHFQYKL